MKPRIAKQRYTKAMMGSALAYLAAVFGSRFLEDKVIDGSFMGIAVSLIPGFFIALMVWSVWRYMRETDEVTRHDHTAAMLFSLYSVLIFTGGWGLVELFNDSLPRIPIFYVFSGFFLVFGAVSCIKFKRWV